MKKKSEKESFVVYGDKVQAVAILIWIVGIGACVIVGIIKMTEDVAAILLVIGGGAFFYLLGLLLSAYGRMVSCIEEINVEIVELRDFLENEKKK